MSNRFLCVTIRYLQPYAHGRGETGDPEWPPSPLRMFQALVASAAAKSEERRSLEFGRDSLEWLESLPRPILHACVGVHSTAPYRLYVPDNVSDKVANSWRLGNEASIADFRTEKDVSPTHLGDESSVHYLYPLSGATPEVDNHLEVLRMVARSITHLGWGIDMVAGNAEVISEEDAARFPGERWTLAIDGSGTPLRVPVPGTLDALIERHDRFLNRLSDDGFRPVPPLTKFKIMNYRRPTDEARRPHEVFQLIDPEGGKFSYSQEKFIHIAGMVRHLAIEAMLLSRPQGTPETWVETYVRGKGPQSAESHRRFSYIPLPSIGHEHADQRIRRVMLAAPPGDGHWLRFLTDRLLGQRLKPDPDKGPHLKSPPLLIRAPSHTVQHLYLRQATTWASVTPVILPGHNDRSPAKTCKLIDKSLRQAGIEVPCEYEWGAISWFRRSLSAHKYQHLRVSGNHRDADEQGRVKKEIGYIRPGHLKDQTAVHMRITFPAEHPFTGPLVLGAGRHCGFGLFASVGD